MMKRFIALLGILIFSFVLGVGCSHTPPPQSALDISNTALTPEQIKQKEQEAQLAERRQQARKQFKEAYALYEDASYREACIKFHKYLETYSPDDEDYEWAEFFFGVGLKKLGFSHASIDTLAHLVIRRPNPKIITYCMELFEETTRNESYDHALIINQVLCEHEYGFVEPNVSDFISYYQGVFDWEHGFHQWGNDHFSRIRPQTYYYYRYLYQEALLRIYQDQIDEAIVVLKEILVDTCRDEALKDDALKTLARLFYEKENFEAADASYHSVKKNILKQGHNLMERAWTQFRMGNAERAMGMLYAFEAPSFQQYFTPEYYILKSFIYKDVCHYEKALNVVNDFKARYGDALTAIYERKPPLDNQALMVITLNKKNIREKWDFLTLLEREKKAAKSFKDKELVTHLTKLYDLTIKEKKIELIHLVESEYERLADELLRYEEEAHLMEYEIGLDMYKRVNQYHFEAEAATRKEHKKAMKVVYPFQGEFWNDELANYKVVLPDKCKTMEEWDIFFK